MNESNTNRTPHWLKHIEQFQRRVERVPPPPVEGVLTRMIGLTLEASGCQAAVGDRCDVIATDGTRIEAEVVGFSGDRLFLMPTGDIHGLKPNARVIPRVGADTVAVGPQLLGRVIDGAGQPLDGRGALECEERVRLTGVPMNPLARQPISEPLDVGVRTINSVLTVGRGQRVGLFAGSGVGKSVLLGMMARYTSADVIVVGLIGERGREVKEFIEDILGEDGIRRSVVVAAPADAPPLVRMQGANYATVIAEHFRDRGKNVLLLMDSLTRYAMAQREIALAIGEPPATKGYPPSCFAKLPQLVERSGNGRAREADGSGGGSITAFYTVLSEGDDPNDPIADAARGIPDGHIVLSRELAEAGHYPAIDIERSVSRVMTNVAASDHVEAARRFRQLHARHQKARDLIQLGAYVPGHDAELDLAVRLHAPMDRLLQQNMNEPARLDDSLAMLHAVLAA